MSGKAMRKNRLISVILGFVMVCSLLVALPQPAYAAAPSYYPGDIAIINKMIEKNGLDWPKAPSDGSSIPGEWIESSSQLYPGIIWSSTGVSVPNKRIDGIILVGQGLKGDVDLTGLTELGIINLNQNNITTLKGTDLSDLTVCYLDNNQLTKIDLPTSKLLRQLSCSENPGLKNLNVSIYPSMETLQCNKCALTALDVSSLTALNMLICSNNQIAGTLDVSKSKNIEILQCYYNKLTTLKITGLSKLKDLECGNNMLSSLDASTLTGLKTFWCDNNQLTTLKLPKTKTLTEIYCSDNRLKSLDATGLSGLTRLDCQNNQLNTLNLAGLGSLETLYCFNNCLTYLDPSAQNIKYIYGYNQTISLKLEPNGSDTLSAKVKFNDGVYFKNDTYSYVNGQLRSTYDINQSVQFYWLYSETQSTPSFYGTISLSYAPHYSVYFDDGPDKPLKQSYVAPGATAVPPPTPLKVGYTFAGWDKDFTNVQAHLVVNAKWTKNPDPIVFDDVESKAWYDSSVDFVSSAGIMTGINSEQFAPNQNINRGQVITVLYRLENPNAKGTEKNTSGLKDVKDNQYYTAAVNWGVKNGIISGYKGADGTKTFKPGNEISRQELVTIIYNYSKYRGEVEGTPDTTNLNKLKDAQTVSPYAKTAFAWCADHNIISGVNKADGRYASPQGTASRAMMAKMTTDMIKGF